MADQKKPGLQGVRDAVKATGSNVRQSLGLAGYGRHGKTDALRILAKAQGPNPPGGRSLVKDPHDVLVAGGVDRARTEDLIRELADHGLIEIEGEDYIYVTPAGFAAIGMSP